MKEEIIIFVELAKLIFDDGINEEQKLSRLESIFLKNSKIFFKSLNVEDEEQSSLLHFAAEKGLASIVKILLHHAKNDFDRKVIKFLDCNPEDSTTKNCISELLKTRELTGHKKYISNTNFFFPHFLNKQNNEGFSALHLAAREDCLEAVTELIAYEADIDLQDNLGYTALHWAAAKDNDSIISKLIDSGARTDIISYDLDETNQQLAKISLNIPILMYQIHAAPFNIAILRGNNSFDHLLINKLTDISSHFYNSLRLKQNFVCRILLEKGLDFNFRDHAGNNLLGAACLKSDDSFLIEKLIDINFDINSKNKYGWSPLHNAIHYDKILNVVKLLQRKADVNIKDYRENTPLHAAVLKDNVGIARIILDAGADLDAQDYEGNTPLHYAVIHHKTSFVKILLKRGANVHILNKQNQTIMDLLKLKKNLIMQTTAHHLTNFLLSGKFEQVTETDSISPSQNNVRPLNRKRKLELII